MKILKMLFTNTIFFSVLIIGYYFNDYSFFIKSFFYIALILLILSQMTILKDDKSFSDYYIRTKSNEKTFIYFLLSFLVDIPFLLMFAVLDYKIIFILYLVNVFFYISITQKTYEKRNNLEEK